MIIFSLLTVKILSRNHQTCQDLQLTKTAE